MSHVRECSRLHCHEAAVATMTYGYEDATAVLGPLSPTAEPGALDLCASHAHSVTVPRGWSMVRLVTEFEPAPPSDADLQTLVREIRKAATRDVPEPSRPARGIFRTDSDVPDHRGKLAMVPAGSEASSSSPSSPLSSAPTTDSAV
ncbi:MAG: DUF3499 domain-containing protein [Ancrocorticia sp.]|uniref:DUF3499 domain-containing protein n=1 Tax=Ancrocorticia sp. TaxID=2593684 RepID=UPI003F918C08